VVREHLGGSQNLPGGKMSAMAYFLCSQFDKAMSHLLSFATPHVSEKLVQFTIV
jgi:hypothetical protein